MDNFIKAAAFTIVAVILWLILSGYSKHFSVLLSVAVCAILLLSSSVYLSKILDFARELRVNSGLNEDIFAILLRTVGVAILVEILALICNDAGNSAMGKTLTLVGSIVIVWCSLPAFSALLDLIGRILGEL